MSNLRNDRKKKAMGKRLNNGVIRQLECNSASIFSQTQETSLTNPSQMQYSFYVPQNPDASFSTSQRSQTSQRFQNGVQNNRFRCGDGQMQNISSFYVQNRDMSLPTSQKSFQNGTSQKCKNRIQSNKFESGNASQIQKFSSFRNIPQNPDFPFSSSQKSPTQNPSREKKEIFPKLTELLSQHFNLEVPSLQEISQIKQEEKNNSAKSIINHRWSKKENLYLLLNYFNWAKVEGKDNGRIFFRSLEEKLDRKDTSIYKQFIKLINNASSNDIDYDLKKTNCLIHFELTAKYGVVGLLK